MRKPRALRPGATIGIAAPSFAVASGRLAAGRDRLAEVGFATRWRDDVVAASGYLAGSDARRGTEFMELVNDEGVDAILCARGGYGCHRIVPLLDAAKVRAAAKPLLGYSDVTTLLLWQLRRAGLVGFHAPMLDHDQPLLDEEREALVRALTGVGDEPVRWRGEGRGGGTAEGRLLGGSLTLLAASLGTPWEIETDGAILMLEEIGEKPYVVDRLLHQLRAAGRLDGVVGVGVGHLVGCTDPKREAPTAEDVVEEVLGSLGLPLVFGLPFGHGRPNLPWPVGVPARIDGDRGELAILESGVTRR